MVGQTSQELPASSDECQKLGAEVTLKTEL